jgi:predicted HTH domain antitoxin
MTLTSAIPDEIASELGGSEKDVSARVQRELAVICYEAGAVSVGRAAEMSGLKRGEFESLLSERRAVRNYSCDDWADDRRFVAGSI